MVLQKSCKDNKKREIQIDDIFSVSKQYQDVGNVK